VESFATGELRMTHIEQATRPDAPTTKRWRAVFQHVRS
jgi:hypothetical protein